MFLLGDESKKLENSHMDVKYTIGNIVNNIVTTMCGAKWVLELSRESLHRLYHYLTIGWTLETNI